MRDTMKRLMHEFAADSSNFMAVIDDTGFEVFEEFEEKFPSQFVNVGIAEQQVIGFCSGLALEGLSVLTYNVCTFYIRAMDQIRIDLAYQQAGVVMVGVGGGLYYGTQGPTHHATEDIALFRAIPNMTVICPADPVEMEAALRQSFEVKTPTYIRICKNRDPILHKSSFDFKIGKAAIMKDGTDVALIATGGMVGEALSVSEKLEKCGISARVVSMHTIKPIDRDMITECVNKFSAVFTLEEHTIIGGLGSAVAEVTLTLEKKPTIFHMFGFPDCFAPVTGSRDYLNAYYGLDAASMADTIFKKLKK